MVLRLIQLGSLLYVISQLSKPAYGELALLISIQQLLALLCVGGLMEAIMGRYKSADPPQTRPVLWNRTWLAYAWSAVTAIALAVGVFPLVNHWLPTLSWGAYSVALVAGLTFGAVALEAGMYRVAGDHLSSALSRGVPASLGFVLAAVAVSIRHEAFVYFAGLIAGAGIGRVCVAPLLPKRRPPSVPHHTQVNELIRASIPYLIVALCGWLSGVGLNFIVAHYVALADIANLSFILSILGALSLIPYAVNQAWYPRMMVYAGKADASRLATMNMAVSGGTTLLLGMLTYMVVSFFHEFLALGKLLHYADIHAEFAVAALSFAFLAMHYTSDGYFLIKRAGSVLMALVALTSIATATVVVFLVAKFGPWGAYVGIVALALSRGLAELMYARRAWNVRCNWFAAAWLAALTSLAYFSGSAVESLVNRLALALVVGLVTSVLCAREYQRFAAASR